MKNRFIAFSGGVESSTMCLLYGDKAKAIFADTGWEHAAMYARIDKVEKELKAIHPNFEIIKVQNKKHGKLQDYIKTQKFYPSQMARYCTRMFKIEPIDDFLKSQGDCELMIGLNAEEGDRVGNHQLVKNIKYTYPLLKNGITRTKCIELLKKFDLVPALPPYMQRGGCVGCFYKSKKEFIAMANLSPEEFEDVCEIEEAIQDKRDDYFSIRDSIPRMRDLKKQMNLFSNDEMYDLLNAEKQTSCGVFCHR